MKSVLEREFAESRKKQIGDIYYDLSLRFEPKSDKYSGNCKIKFYLKNKGKGISFESISDIKKIWVNGKEAKYQRNGAFVMLEEGLEEGKENEIEVEYEAKYDHTGDGLHQFIDPEDGNEYIYSNFEPYDAHRMFHCFDQPALKAVLKLTIEIPHEWEFILGNRWKSTFQKKIYLIGQGRVWISILIFLIILIHLINMISFLFQSSIAEQWKIQGQLLFQSDI